MNVVPECEWGMNVYAMGSSVGGVKDEGSGGKKLPSIIPPDKKILFIKQSCLIHT